MVKGISLRNDWRKPPRAFPPGASQSARNIPPRAGRSVARKSRDRRLSARDCRCLLGVTPGGRDFADEETCRRCKQQRREILNRQVCDLVRQYGCLGVVDKEILGWYIMLPEEDRKIIKETGTLTEFMQNNPSLYIANNWVTSTDGSPYSKMEKSAAKVCDFNKSRQGTFSCVWSCDNCGFSNSFEVSTCSQCQETMKQLEGRTHMQDELDLKTLDSTSMSCSFESCCDLSVCDRSGGHGNNTEQKQSPEEMEICQGGTLQSNSEAGEPCSDIQKVLEETHSSSTSELKEWQLNNDQSIDTQFRMFSRSHGGFSSTFQDGEVPFHGSTKLIVPGEEQPYEAKRSLCEPGSDFADSLGKPDLEVLQPVESMDAAIDVGTQHVNGDTDQWEESVFNAAPNSDHKLNVETAMDPKPAEEFLAFVECPSLIRQDIMGEELIHDGFNLVIGGEPSGKEMLPYNRRQKSVFLDDGEIVHISSEDLEDSGITAENELLESEEFYFGFEDPSGQEADPSTLQWQKHLSDPTECPENQDCSASDIFDDTFLSIRSGSCNSLHSNASSDFSLDYYTYIEEHNFEEALEDLTKQTSCDQANQPESLPCIASGKCHQNVTMFPSTEVRKTLMSRGCTAEVALQDKLLSEWRAEHHRNVSCNTDLSWVSDSKHEKASQTTRMNTQNSSTNTDISMPGCYPLSRDSHNAVNLSGGDSNDAETHKGPSDTESGKSRASASEHATLAVLAALLESSSAGHGEAGLHQQVQRTSNTYVFGTGSSRGHRDSGGKKAAVSFDLLSVLAEVEEKYERMKEQIQGGQPLDSLPPLFVPLTKTDIPANSLSSKCLSEVFQQSREQEASKSSKYCLPAVSQGTKDLESVSVEDCVTTSLPMEFQDHQEEEFSKVAEVSDDWFDAKENLTVACPRGMPQGQMDKTRDCQPPGMSQRLVSAEANQSDSLADERRGGFYIHVGNLPYSITEVELNSHFQKYQVSEVFLQALSVKSSYAVLTVKSTAQAQAAVMEMNGKEIGGRAIKVRSIKVAEQSVSFTFQAFHQPHGTPLHFKAKLASSEPKGAPGANPILNRSSEPSTNPWMPLENVSNAPTFPKSLAVPNAAALRAPGLEKVAAASLNSSTIESSMPPHGTMQNSSSIPVCWMPGSSSLTPAMSMVEPWPSPWMAYSGNQNRFVLNSTSPSSWLPTDPSGQFRTSALAPLFAPSISQALTKPVSNCQKKAQPAHVTSTAKTSVLKEWSRHIPAKQIVPPCSVTSSNSSITTSTITGPMQTNAKSVQDSLGSTGKIPASNYRTATRKLTALPAKITASNSVPSPATVITPAKTTTAALEKVTSAVAITVPASVPITVPAPAKATSAVLAKVTAPASAKVSSSISSRVALASQEPTQLMSGTPLREPVSVPKTVIIPMQMTTETSRNVTTEVPTSSTAALSLSARASVVPLTKRSISAPSLCSVVSGSASNPADCIRKGGSFPSAGEDWNVLGPLTKLPAYIPPNTLNLGSFAKLLRRLIELHPEASRDQIIRALQDVRNSRGGSLNGVPIEVIAKKASGILTRLSIPHGAGV
ncbi:RNA-binding protein 44 isoform X3 [Ascaphus truei]|uniref:RNA-binding protein 44 isoform X3 n=1 Tax=Ascaphus truei TaxID=8439 RepID=UPI003F5A4376